MHGLAQLPADELAAIADALDARDDVLGHALGRNRPVWDAERARVRGWLADRRRDDERGGVSARSLYLLDSRAASRPDDLRGPDGPGPSVADGEAVVRAALPDGPVRQDRGEDRDQQDADRGRALGPGVESHYGPLAISPRV